MPSPPRKPGWLVWLEYLPAVLLLPLLRCLPHRAGLALARWLGTLGWLAMPGYRAVARVNLRIACGEHMDNREIRRLTRASFINLLQTAYEFALLARLERHAVARLTHPPEGYEEYRAALARGRGVIACGIHLGNWYWPVVGAALEGFAVHVVVRPLDNPRLDALMNAAFARHGVEVIPRRRVFPRALAVLRRGETLGLMIDQNAAVGGSFVPLFGVPASTMRGLAALRRTGAEIVLVHDVRDAGKHRITARWLRELPTDEDACLAALHRQIEPLILRHREQYLWLHPRWKHRPPGEAPLYRRDL